MSQLSAEQELSPLARARGWTLEQDQKLERGLHRAEWSARAEAQRLINNRLTAASTEDVPTGAVDQQQRPREHRARRSQRSTSRGDPDPEPEPPLETVPLARFRQDVRHWLEAVAR